MKRHIFGYTAAQLLPYIDWSYFFHAWGIAQRASGSKQAQEVKNDATALLQEAGDSIVAKGIFALCNARGCDDNIIMEDGTTLPLLRQQHARAGEPNICLSDFVAPHGDQIGLFATTVCNIWDTSSNDDYRNLIIQTTASRLAEATATLMHKEVRTNSALWGYAPNEQLTPEELNLEKFQGIRPAVGYPSLPDQSIIFTMDKLLGLNEIGIELTPNGAMNPHASVCGIMIAHPAARYFAVGDISQEQLADYAHRRGLPPEELHKFLFKNIAK